MRALRRPEALVVLLTIAAVALRIAVLGGRGFPSDVDEIVRWAHRIASEGLGQMYARGPQGVNYPALLYVLWPLAAWAHDDVLRIAVKALSIPFDIAIGGLLYVVAGAQGRWRGVLAAALYWLAPATVIAGPFWGQIDAVGTLPFVAALVAAGKGRWLTAGTLAAIAALLKPQFGLAAVVVIVAAAVGSIRSADARPLLRTAGGGLAALAAISMPLGLTVDRSVRLVLDASGPWPYTSLYAFNPWGLTVGFLKPDEGYFAIGAALFAIGLALSLIPLWWRRDVAALLAVGTYAVFAFYFLPTRIHERYLFPALATLAPLAAMRSRLLVPYVTIAAMFTLSLLYMLSENAASTGVVAPSLVRSTVFSWTGVQAIGTILIGASVLSVWRTLTGGASILRGEADAPPSAIALTKQK